MGLSNEKKRQLFEAELNASQDALNSHKLGIIIHKIVSNAFKKEIEKLPKPKKKIVSVQKAQE